MSELLSTDYTKQSHQLTKLETDLLIQYQNLARRLHQLSEIINKLVNVPSAKLLENLEDIENKMALVFTLFKGAVYSLFLQQEGAQNEDPSNQESYSTM
ncbi:hypothetical protein BN7_6098 [Wickerhamomyces ciferrii]|uniref:DASH complex subunit DAD3 n=1 Tax=Wickerhamomyces ciferrii (strain ATCC 14091 / BCRC 22168 / CBS 111 / JCM 3599 / NBRC 0793 / NRRL Y-1031 F-60-10) TaxID=1206466 RepID=K0KMJ9_WICCF|nr:uncharacterized protein BN7_6098 [Wickerhamomyces ciferrii]CCH46505.1 hypothetical protein BN7_6098 [Wickerhamomyces ciferrii]